MPLFCVKERVTSEELWDLWDLPHFRFFFFPFWPSEVNLAAMRATVFN